jgi:protein-S-isoprenylcysteine O-methyltransferase Ste14
MMMVLRHLLAILLLPFIVVVVVPYWLLNSFTDIDTRWGNALPIAWLAQSTGLVLFVCGLVLLSWCVSLFASVGQGTLAPWDPTQKLVAVGPYRYVRNPMISGVALMLVGQSLSWGSWIIGIMASIFVFVNHTYFVLLEEPGLERRFGEDYRVYKANVPRWIPRLRPPSGK